jgi:hypothetical protein
MALVNQETNSIQGNANYILYKLAAQQPSAFHDVPTGGTIAMPCATGSPNCVTSKSGDAYGVLSGYATTSGYDLATGLGSMDANNFVTKWSTVTTTLKTSTTTLTLNSGNPVNITHGQSVSVAIGVTGSLGTPTGNVSLLANTGPDGTEGVQGFALGSGGSASGTTNALPGGTYTVVANYPGDGIFGASASTPPISVTVAPEASKASIAYELFSPTTGLQTSPNATTAVFGTPARLLVNVTSQAGDACPNNNNASQDSACPTGNVVLTDNSNPLDGGTFRLNAQGYTEDQLIDLTGGSHNLTATYSGDNSYTAPVGPATEVLTITPAATSTAISSFGSTKVTLGSSVDFSAILAAQNIYSDIFPTGTISFFSGATLLGTTSFQECGENAPGFKTACATFGTSTLPHGQSSVTAQYSGDASYAGSTSAPIAISVIYPTQTAITSSTTTVLQGQNVTFTAQVTGEQAGTAITGTVQFVSNSPGTVVICNAVALSASGQATCTTSSLSPGLDSVYATYSGDSNYAPSGSSIVAVTVNNAFTISANPMTISISAPGQSGSTMLTFTSMSGFSGSATLSAANCTGLPLKASCSFSPAMVSLPANGTATTTLTIATSAAFLPIRETGPRRNPLSGWRVSIFEAFLAMFLYMVALTRSIRGPGRRWSAATGSLVLAIAIALIACGGGGGGGSGGGGGGSNSGTPPGQYMISVSATINGASQVISGLSVNVQ